MLPVTSSLVSRTLTRSSRSLSLQTSKKALFASAASYETTFSVSNTSHNNNTGSNTADSKPHWSDTLTFASPESDFCDGITASKQQEASRTFLSTSNGASASATEVNANAIANTDASWSNSLLFASPESDFCDTSIDLPVALDRNRTTASVVPKSYFLTTAVDQHTGSHEQHWSHTLSFASPESDYTDGSRSVFALSQRESPFPHRPPRTLAQAMQSSQACVVTTVSSPHRIVAVNAAWETLCGYTQCEVHGQTLSVIQGPATNQSLTQVTVQAALESSSTGETKSTHQYHPDMYVVNYKKSGQPFTNHVTLATMQLSDDQPDVEFLVGVLEPVTRSPLRFIG